MRAIHRGRQLILDFLASEAAGGLVLMAAAALALAVANSPFSENYIGALHTYIGPLSVHHWINDAAMALFFLPLPALGQVILQYIATIAVYPLVAGLAGWLFGLPRNRAESDTRLR